MPVASTAARPSLLFVAPILPAPTGNGLAMRAGVFLDALAQDFSVTLVIVPVAGGDDADSSSFVAERTQRAVTLPIDDHLDPLWSLSSRLRDATARATALAAYPRPAACRFATTPARAAFELALVGKTFDAVHVMRSYIAPYASPELRGPEEAPFATLDLDDDETATHLRLAALAEREGPPHEALLMRAEAEKYARLEAAWLPSFGTLIACTRAHAEQLMSAYPHAAVAVVPNTVMVPPLAAQRAARGKRLIFVGNLSYRPNVAGIAAFVRDVLPRLRLAHGDRLELTIAGRAPAPEVSALASVPGVEVIADPPHLAPHYASADIAIVPLAAGGGTRIKMLEAFAHGVPVVATTIGAEGIAAIDGVHLLIADDDASFAAACTRLIGDRARADEMAARARALVERDYAHAAGVQAIRAAFGSALRR